MPLKARVTQPFAESQTGILKMQESPTSFEIIRKFLYCQTINFVGCSPEVPFALDRWGLGALVEPFFLACIKQGKPLLGICARCPPAMCIFLFRLYSCSFMQFFVRRFTAEFELHGMNWFSDESFLEVMAPVHIIVLKSVGFKETRPFPQGETHEDDAAQNAEYFEPSSEQRETAVLGRFADQQRPAKRSRLFAYRTRPRFYCDDGDDILVEEAQDVMEQDRSTVATTRDIEGDSGLDEKISPLQKESSPGTLMMWLPASKIWEILLRYGFVKAAIEGLFACTEQEVSHSFLDLVLIRLVDNLTDAEILDALELFHWGTSCSRLAIKEAAEMVKASGRCWRLVARAQATQIAGADTATIRVRCEDLSRVWDTAKPQANSIGTKHCFIGKPTAINLFGVMYSCPNITSYAHIETENDAGVNEAFVRVFLHMKNSSELRCRFDRSRSRVRAIVSGRIIICGGDGIDEDALPQFDPTVTQRGEMTLNSLTKSWVRQYVLSPTEVSAFRRELSQRCSLQFVVRLCIERCDSKCGEDLSYQGTACPIPQ